ncbi:MAG: putative sulfate/molybdate transporter [Thermaerobacter sp.]|nr:putative sulfate/molybdate transporter [Thermaerobacter sp.]
MLPGNRYGVSEWAGAFGDIGTLIPFVLAYVTVLHINPVGVLFSFAVAYIVVGMVYKTPIPVQPMKAIGGFALGHPHRVSPAMVWAAGLIVGLAWMILGLSRAVEVLSRLAAKPVVRGIMLGLGITFAEMGIAHMSRDWPLAALGVAVALGLFATRFPAMFALLLIGSAGALLGHPGLPTQLAQTGLAFRLPSFGAGFLAGPTLSRGFFLLALPQLPLTLGNAIIAITHENNGLFPQHPVTERKIAISTGIMNLLAPWLGGVPMCHGAGGMAGHVRFNARTGGSLVILGSLVLVLALFGGPSTRLILQSFPSAIVGVILFFAGMELAVTVQDIGSQKQDVYLMLFVAALAIWNMGAAFLAGVILSEVLRRGWVRV